VFAARMPEDGGAAESDCAKAEGRKARAARARVKRKIVNVRMFGDKDYLWLDELNLKEGAGE